jgi:dienelactone hydrolase
MLERPLTISTPYEEIAGLLWLPDAAPPSLPLVIAGHGFTQHKRALYPITLVDDLTSRGFAVAVIDAPKHGDRAADPKDRASVDAAWRAHWSKFAAARIADEHTALLDQLCAMREINGRRVGYFGLSLGTQYGVGILANEHRVRAAVLGLSALPDPGPRIAAYAERVMCPVFFIQQLDDEIALRHRASALFERIGAREKTLRASSGAHTEVPRAVFEEAYDFLVKQLTPDP